MMNKYGKVLNLYGDPQEEYTSASFWKKMKNYFKENARKGIAAGLIGLSFLGLAQPARADLARVFREKHIITDVDHDGFPEIYGDPNSEINYKSLKYGFDNLFKPGEKLMQVKIKKIEKGSPDYNEDIEFVSSPKAITYKITLFIKTPSGSTRKFDLILEVDKKTFMMEYNGKKIKVAPYSIYYIERGTMN